MRHWLLPEHIEDVLPQEAAHMESLRRHLLDMFRTHGYQLVIPPLLEYTESLSTGAGHDLDMDTFKVVDLLSGRLMGIRADITPQVARIDAHLLNQRGTTRLCYAGSVLRTRPDGLARTREPIQLGAELFGHAGIASDVEIQRLLVQALQSVGVAEIHLDISHVGIFRALVRRSPVAQSRALEIHAALLTKDVTTLRDLLHDVEPETRAALLAMVTLNGGVDILNTAHTLLPASDDIQQALQEMRHIAEQLAPLRVQVMFDLAELRGYHYHNGLVFAAYATGYAGPLALGGRYDEIGAAFGRARPATGFSLDLRGLIAALPTMPPLQAILAPSLDDAALTAQIAALRAAGEVVIVEFPEQEAYRQELGCDRQLLKKNGQWVVVAVTSTDSNTH